MVNGMSKKKTTSSSKTPFIKTQQLIFSIFNLLVIVILAIYVNLNYQFDAIVWGFLILIGINAFYHWFSVTKKINLIAQIGETLEKNTKGEFYHRITNTKGISSNNSMPFLNRPATQLVTCLMKKIKHSACSPR